ncbi:hypothetical protein EIP91_006597 [Steccherinum ochraceum]|uniref:RNA polymerase II-associated protein 1 C-terminal domain-containing protein n=1 Tax=Steccherinum ochraceum TaxID=92696 RepID=A0A4R0RK17_9APHY|nr:hypothetical protein EIP91_006597 [Steccherinum ochraceum]
MSASLVGSVFERKGGSSAPRPPKLNGTGTTGFPAAKHRSQSAFAKARNEANRADRPTRPQHVPAVESTRSSVTGPSTVTDTGDWRRQMEKENEKKVEDMTDEEREQERREILERFGPNIAEVLRKAREARENAQETTSREELSIDVDAALKSPSTDKRVIKSAMASRPSSPTPGSADGTRPSSRTDRRLRFAELTPKDVHVYESAPPSPRKKALALPPPTPEDGPTVSLGSLGVVAKLPSPSSKHEDPLETQETLEEGTPEDIRRRFFPSAAAHAPSLEWIEASDSTPGAGPSDSTLRFDLTGAPIPPEISSTLPTHLGLHHHAEGSHAGYTLDDLFLLSRSTVPAQRASMLDVLGRIVRKIGKSSRARGKSIQELEGQEADLRKRVLAAGVEAMGERGTLGIKAVEVMWACVVAWDEDLVSTEGVELKDFSSDGALASIPLDFVLPHVSAAFSAGGLPQESLSQLLAIIHRLAQESNEIARAIVDTKDLVASLIQTFILTPYPPDTDSPLPEPFAIQVLTTLASSSRASASTLMGPADTLLRFLLTTPSTSPYTTPLATSLLTATFRLYIVLASYGLYSQTAATAHEHLHQIQQYVLSDVCTSVQLREAWLGLLEAWTTCARDPHATSPDHDILWSQIVGWGWAEDILSLRARLTAEQSGVWSMLWRAVAAWLEGASVNGVRGGESEKNAVLDVIRDGFLNGIEHVVIESCMRELGRILDAAPDAGPKIDLKELSVQANILASAIRLWLSSLPSSSQHGLDAPPFSLPFPQLSQLCGRLATHRVWDHVYSGSEPSIAHVQLRSVSRLLSAYLDMSRVLPSTSEDSWMAQALTVLSRLLPGDDEVTARIISAVANVINPAFMDAHQWQVPSAIWDKKGLEPILPFLTYSLRKNDVLVGSMWMTPHSIQTATTQRLPPLSTCRPTTRSELALPLNRDWMFSPLDYLLRSGQTDVFKSLPSSWDASETDMVRASLLLARVVRQTLTMHSLNAFVLSREETIFGCMKVFMLEHGQQQDSTASTEEVFRDSIVGDSMDDLLGPFTLAASGAAPLSQDSFFLDAVATRFLGPSTPFYQFYTDFVGLYDAISFSNPLFARLILPPLSMRYPSDYRKYLWVDYAHVIRTIKTPVEAVVAGSLEEFLWPVESNAEIISGYLRAITKGHAEGFLRLVAVHHLACNIWPDLREVRGDEGTGAERATKLLQALVGQAGFEGVREVVLYRQTREMTLLPPSCFEQDGNWKFGRREFARRCGGEVKDRLEKLL